MTISLFRRAVLLATLIICAAACDRKPSPAAAPGAQVTPDSQGIIFGAGFHKEEASPTATLRWVRRDAAMSVQAPAAGHYRLTFRPFTVFSKVENTIDVSVGGQSAGKISTHASDPSAAVPTPVEVNLRAGSNEVSLHSAQPEVRLGESDDRMAAYGLLLPTVVERLP